MSETNLPFLSSSFSQKEGLDSFGVRRKDEGGSLLKFQLVKFTPVHAEK